MELLLKDIDVDELFEEVDRRYRLTTSKEEIDKVREDIKNKIENKCLSENMYMKNFTSRCQNGMLDTFSLYLIKNIEGKDKKLFLMVHQKRIPVDL